VPMDHFLACIIGVLLIGFSLFAHNRALLRQFYH